MNGKIEITRGMAADLTMDLVTQGDYERRVAAREDLRALLAAPVVERQPVAIVDESDDGMFIEFIYGENGNPLQRGDILYADPPAPVAVVLPERRAVSEQSREQAMCANSWNACLDKVKELNQ